MKNQKGFTLLELALAMLVVGIIVSLLASGLQAYLEKTRIDTTKHRINIVQDAITEFLDVRRRYPCPARINVAPGQANFGVETFNASDAPEVNCNGTNSLGGGGTISPTGIPTRRGSVPVRTLNLSDEYMVDGWGNRFTYSVTKDLASDNTSGEGTLYTPDGGEIIMYDSSLTAFANDAHYVLVSHGKTGSGSIKLFSTSTTPPLACPPRSGANMTLDAFNCDDNATYVVTLLNSENGTTFYDDHIIYTGQQESDNVPTGAVMAFNLSSCPVGWSDFTQANGRFIIGTRSNRNFRRFQYSDDGSRADVTTTGSNDVVSLALGQTSSAPSVNGIPPYISLRYCQKN